MNNKLNFTFLTEEQVFGENQLDIFKKYGIRSAVTDFARFSGAVVDDWWTKSVFEDDDGYVPVIDHNTVSVVDGETINNYRPDNDNIGVRPAISYSSIKSDCINETINDCGIKEVLYGEYPQTVVDEKFSSELERFYNYARLSKTGKRYDFPEFFDFICDEIVCARTYIEYEYREEKYIRFVADSNNESRNLSDGRKYEKGKVYWIRVEPITWLVDEKADIALSKNILFSGVQFDNRKEYKGDFENTNIKKFMDEYFSKEIEIETKKPDKFSNKENFEQDNLEELKRLKEEIKQLDEEIKQSNEEIKQSNEEIKNSLKEIKNSLEEINQSKKKRTLLQKIKEVIVGQSYNEKVSTHGEKKKHK